MEKLLERTFGGNSLFTLEDFLRGTRKPLGEILWNSVFEELLEGTPLVNSRYEFLEALSGTNLLRNLRKKNSEENLLENFLEKLLRRKYLRKLPKVTTWENSPFTLEDIVN